MDNGNVRVPSVNFAADVSASGSLLVIRPAVTYSGHGVQLPLPDVMTCVWNSLLAGLTRAGDQEARHTNATSFVSWLKDKNVRVADVTVNGATLRPTEVEENFQAVEALREDALHHGYLTSASDPVFILVCHLCRVHIRCLLDGHTIVYGLRAASERAGASAPDASHEIVLRSTRSHMSFVSVERMR